MIASARRKWFGLALLLLVQFMVVLDIAIVNVALPSIQTDLGFSQENLQWVISAYALFFGGFLLLGGRLADLLGRRRLFLVGIVLFTAASLVSGVAWSEGALIAARAVPGPRRRDHHACRVVDPHHHVRRGQGAQRRARRVGCGRSLRGGRRRPARRRPHRPAELAVDLLREHPHRHPRARAHAVPDRREPGRNRGELRRPRRRARDQRARHARLRHHPGEQLRLGLDRDDRPLRRRRSCSWPRSSAGKPARRTR